MERAVVTLETERVKWPTLDVYDDDEVITNKCECCGNSHLL